MYLLNRRKFVGSVGAGLLLAPFISLVNGDKKAKAAGKAKRLLLFCTMGTNPDMWSPTGVSGENKFTFSAMTAPLAAIKQNVILIEGCPSLNPGDGHGAPDGLTGLGYAQTGQVPIISVDQFVANSLVSAGTQTPINALLLGADSTAGGGRNMFYNGKDSSNCMSTIGSPMSAFTTAFGAALPTGTTMSSLVSRRKSILDAIMAEITGLQGTLGATEKAKLDQHLDSIRQLESKLQQQSSGSSGGGAPVSCTKPAQPPADSTFTPAGTQTVAANAALQGVLLAALACNITRVGGIHYGSDQKLQVTLPSQMLNDDQHGGFIHSGAASNYKNLVTFEAYLAGQFASMVQTLGSTPEPDGSGMLLDNTIVAWCRDMGDSVVHNQNSMRFVLAGGTNGYLKLDPNGRYLDMRKMSAPANRHERVLLALIDAMGISNFKGFGDPNLGSNKTPLPGIAA